MEPKAVAAFRRRVEAKDAFDTAAVSVGLNPRDDEAWRELCRARATLRALAR